MANGIILYLCFLLALSFHEFAHAWVANKCGDNTAKADGRLTINPLAHIDPLGTVILPLFMILLPLIGTGGEKLSGFIIGWAKPVPVDPSRFGKYRLQDSLVSLAGPASNFLLAFLSMLLFRFLPHGFSEASWMGGVVNTVALFAIINTCLAWFNLIPIPPLDGSHLLKHAVRMSEQTYYRFAQYGIWILILALNFTPLRDILGFCISMTVTLFERIVL